MSLRQSLCNRLSAIGLKQKKVHSLVDETLKWVSRSGTEWTIDRLKDFKLYYIHKLADVEYKPKIWISMRKDGKPKGPFGSLDLSSKRSIVQTFNALNSYTSFISSSPTKKQLKKFLDSVESENEDTDIPIGPVEFQVMESIFRTPSLLKDGRKELPLPISWSDHIFGKTRAPLSDGTSVPEDKVDVWLPDNGLILGSLGLLLKPYRQTLLAAKVRSFVRQTPTYYPSTGGRVAFIQEPGYKLRAVANPFRLWQVLLEPLKTDLFSYLRHVPEDCTYDQQRGISKIQRWLQNGQMVHSIDLSDATNLFPLSYTMGVLTSMYDTTDQNTRVQLDLFVRASRARWALPDKRIVRWNRGQPLGLGPSFAAFAVSHHWVLRKLRAFTGGDYVILGDDVAIKGAKLGRAYIKFMTEQLGCKVSLDKTILSDKIAEFAGRLILPEYNVPTFKWRSISDRSFLDVMRSLGPTSKGLLKKRQRKVVDVLSSVPDFMGGLGWNPNGIPLSERIQLGIDLGLWDDRNNELIARSSSFYHRYHLNKMMYNGVTIPIAACERYATPRPARSRIEEMGTLLGIDSLFINPDLVGGKYRISTPSGDPRGPTTLEVLENRIRKLKCPNQEIGGYSQQVPEEAPDRVSQDTSREVNRQQRLPNFPSPSPYR